MEHEIHQFELVEKAKRLAEFYKDADFNDIDPDDFPQELKDLRQELDTMAELASKAPPRQPDEDEYKELVNVAIPYNVLLALIRAAQGSANEHHMTVHKLVPLMSLMPGQAAQREFLTSILEAMTLNFYYTHLAAELNRIRLEERPAEFVQPGEDDEKHYDIKGYDVPQGERNLPELSSMDLPPIRGEKEFDLKWLLGGDDADSE